MHPNRNSPIRYKCHFEFDSYSKHVIYFKTWSEKFFAIWDYNKMNLSYDDAVQSWIWDQNKPKSFEFIIEQRRNKKKTTWLQTCTQFFFFFNSFIPNQFRQSKKLKKKIGKENKIAHEVTIFHQKNWIFSFCPRSVV